ncbi:N-6 DNA methylase, partial [Saccharothrix sp. MB29]|nr:N-6 DNA methylase [Saccharothrix sp. MB29]
RRRLGTFFTPPAIVKHMMEICQKLTPKPDHVVDPGAGVGAFTLEALRIWTSASVAAVDLNVVTLGLLAARVNCDTVQSDK